MYRNRDKWINPDFVPLARKVLTADPPPDPPPLSSDQVLAWLTYATNDAWWKSQMRINIADIAHAMGMRARITWFRHTRGILHAADYVRLARGIAALEDRRLVVFMRQPKFLWLDVPEDVPKLGKLVPDARWSLHARCQVCHGNKFMPIVLNGEPYVACYGCIPPRQYPAIGARPREKKTSLLRQVIYAALDSGEIGS